MFTVEQRDHVRNYILEMARSDPRVTAGALIGSTAVGAEDRWSDIDIGFGIAEGNNSEDVLTDWRAVLDRDLGVLHHWDLRSGSSIYRVFLFANGVEADISVTPQRDFGARGPRFSVLFGSTKQLEPVPQPSGQHLIGLGWHHVFHARSSIERGKPWRAEYWISEARNQTLSLACLRLGIEAFHARGIDLLPTSITEPLADALVRSLDDGELRRALEVATQCFVREVEAWDPTLCVRLRPMLMQFGAPLLL